jgi:hypothetical protein
MMSLGNLSLTLRAPVTMLVRRSRVSYAALVLLLRPARLTQRTSRRIISGECDVMGRFRDGPSSSSGAQIDAEIMGGTSE